MLINSGNKVNVITPAFIAKLSLTICSISIGMQKIDNSNLKIYGIAIAGFSIQDKSGRAQFFEKTFLLANTSIEVVLELPFLTLNNG